MHRTLFIQRAYSQNRGADGFRDGGGEGKGVLKGLVGVGGCLKGLEGGTVRTYCTSMPLGY